jgi:uncharacterized protein YjiS (DUF1127 family)
MDGNFPLRDLLPLHESGFVQTRPPILVGLADKVLGWIDRARSRRSLALMDDRMLRDIGVDRGTVAQEMQKPFWR